MLPGGGRRLRPAPGQPDGAAAGAVLQHELWRSPLPPNLPLPRQGRARVHVHLPPPPVLRAAAGGRPRPGLRPGGERPRLDLRPGGGRQGAPSNAALPAVPLAAAVPVPNNNTENCNLQNKYTETTSVRAIILAEISVFFRDFAYKQLIGMCFFLSIWVI